MADFVVFSIEISTSTSRQPNQLIYLVQFVQLDAPSSMQLNKIPIVVSEKKHSVSVCVLACVQVHLLSR